MEPTPETGFSSLVFPSLVVRANELEARGAFAEAQAEFLDPDPAVVQALHELLERNNVGVVAHFYMDAELQGVLSACAWPHIHVSDSLLMADRAVAMAKQGVRTIVVLGVDFMSENVRATLDASGHSDVAVYRVASDAIGCSLAESAEAPEYRAYLEQASRTPRSLHVIYINTSLAVKARAQLVVPTITCTSSNVLQTLLAAAAQIPNVSIWFGPDTYMGANLASLLAGLVELGDDAVKALHPELTAADVAGLLERFHYFQQGTCIVHHMFGDEVARRVRRDYADSFVAAHLEVPGEMFALGLEGQQSDSGVVGSTSDILKFIRRKVSERIAGKDNPRRLSFVLGTEAGMVTSIVRDVQGALREHADNGGRGLEAEIVFPVAAEAVSVTQDEGLPLVPGVSGGEGCSTAGGCATCPYMKMNSLDALLDLLGRVGSGSAASLASFEPRQYADATDGRSLAELGTESILHMRDFQADGALPDALVRDVLSRSS